MIAPSPTVTPRRGVVEQVRAASGTTPGRYRLWSLALAALLAVGTVAATASATAMRSSTRRAESRSGPMLVAIQQLVSSLAEADAAASAAFLSGRDEDPEQRRLYEQALARARQQVDDLASLAGQGEGVRTVLGRISVQVTQYAGLIEAARASNRASIPEANQYLVSAVQLAERLVAGDVAALTADTQRSLRRDEGGRTRWYLIAALVLVVALVGLVAAQRTLVRTSRRLVNLPLVLASLCVLAAVGWLLRTEQTGGRALADARRDGYDSIVLTSQLASSGFEAKAAETLAVISGDNAFRSEADGHAADVATNPRGDAATAGGFLGRAAQAADNPRERAAVAEVGVRWRRYVATVEQLRSAPNAAAARAVAVGQANTDFNGFNFSVAGVLGQNRDQFLAGLDEAADLTNALPTGILLLVLAAMVASLWGFQLRINDYR